MTKTPTFDDTLREVIPKLHALTKEVLFDDVWERGELSKRDRSMITVAALVAMHRPVQLELHIERALANGVTRSEITELITHLAFYAGWPSSMTATQVASDVFNKAE